MDDIEKQWRELSKYICESKQYGPTDTDDLKEAKLGPLKPNPEALKIITHPEVGIPLDMLHLHDAVFHEGVEVNDAKELPFGNLKDVELYSEDWWLFQAQDRAILEGDMKPESRVDRYLRESKEDEQ